MNKIIQSKNNKFLPGLLILSILLSCDNNVNSAESEITDLPNNQINTELTVQEIIDENIALLCKKEQETKPSKQSFNIEPVKDKDGAQNLRYTLASRNKFDMYIPDIYPPITGRNDSPVFLIKEEPTTYDAVLNEDMRFSFGKRVVAYAYIDNARFETYKSEGVVGKYPVLGDSRIMQTVGSTHLIEEGTDQAVDIAAPKGTEIVAFKSGKVVLVEDWVNDDLPCGIEHTYTISNKVIILQEDGLEARYGHLRLGSITVKEGDIVEEGQVLGDIGCLNACNSGAHLHFQVGGITEEGLKSLPLYFYTTDDTKIKEATLNDTYRQ